MGSYDRVDFYRKNRDYAGLLEEGGGAEEEADEEPEEYEDEDDDNEGSEQGRKSESDEDPEVARERQEYLERRAKLKELERQKLKRKLNGMYGRKDDTDSEEDKKKLPYDNYGSFFGPSQPVIARRVIEETRARLEAAQVVARIAKEVPEKSYATASYTRHEDNEPPRPKVAINETKKKAQQLKAARDYSFLFSEDGEIPSSRPDNVHEKQAITKHSVPLKKPALSSKQIPSMRDAKGIVKPSRQIPVKAGTQTKAPSAKPRPLNDPRKELNKVGSGLGRLDIQGNGSIQRSVNNGTRVGGVDTNKKKAPPIISNKAGKNELQRTIISHPTGMQKPVSSKAPMQKLQLEQRKPSVLAKPAPKLANKFEARSAARPTPKSTPKLTPNLPPKPQAKSSKPPMTRNMHDERPKKRHRDDDFEDCNGDGNYRSLIREMFGYNPNKYRDIDDDDRAMEVGFNAIQNEERRSARIAREEDERELALIEAEEREERLKAKKRKLQKR